MVGLRELNVKKRYATVVFVALFIITTAISFTILNSNVSDAFTGANYEDEGVGYADVNNGEEVAYAESNYEDEEVAYVKLNYADKDASHIEKNYMAALEEFLMAHEIFFVNPWGTFIISGGPTEDGWEPARVFNPMTGEEIFDAPYMLGVDAFRVGFTLFDIDANGIPEIFILAGVDGTCDVWVEVFVYSDGEYSFAGNLLNKSLFNDISGNLIQQCGWSEMVFDVKFDGLTLQRELFIWHIDGDFRRLFNFRTEQFFDDAFHMNFFTHLDRFEEIDAFPYGPVTRILPLTDLQEHITEIVTNRLLEEGRILREWIRS